MRKLSTLPTLLIAFMGLALGACSSGGTDNSFAGSGNGGTGGGAGPDAPTPATVTVLTSSPQLPSAGGSEVTITALVRDADNRVMADQPVVFSSTSGILTVNEVTTLENGTATASLGTAGDPTNRTITVTADVNGLTNSVDVNVAGTTITLQGPASLAQGDSATYSVVLADSNGDGIAGETVDVTSANGNTLASSSLVTDSQGQAQVQVTASAAGADTLSATALGITDEVTLTVSDDSFVITAPASGTQVPLNTPVTVTVNWTVGGAAQAGETIGFSTTRGTLSAASAPTDANGDASVDLQASNAGSAVITATNPDGTETTVQIQFVATTADSIEVQASPFSVAPSAQSSITAVVRDAAGNLVASKVVDFSLDDVTGGSLSAGSATTNTQGRATVSYTAGSTSSASDGVTITATVRDTPAVTGSVNLTVDQREVDITLGTGNEINEPNQAQYRQEWIVQITDVQGAGVAGVTVQMRVQSNAYFKGFWAYNDVASQWVQNVTAGPCVDEDVNRNGVLDFGEDNNNNGTIEAGNIATVAAQSTGGGTFTTDDNGFGIVDVFYPQGFARWVDVTLTAQATVQGTETTEARSFVLPIAASDVTDENTNPPGNPSPFGQSGNCGDTL
ncbi:Ig-like domain-containing protein [Lentisalinibacter sediminis]|uniref:Ig-like domain-containing protein n=1 Tax=Lentisalinibacter sediminis TaxID=2992237 RepID=UPI003870A22E